MTMDIILNQLRESTGNVRDRMVLREVKKLQLEEQSILHDIVVGCQPGLFLPEKRHVSGARHSQNEVVSDDDTESYECDEEETDSPPGEEENNEAIIRGNEYQVVVNDRVINIWDYLGSEWSTMIRELQTENKLQSRLGLSTEPRPHQITGAAKLCRLGRGPFNGGIQGDEMGLGKSLTSVMACENDKDEVKGCFNLVVTTKTCAPQWANEIRDHFRDGFKPTVFMLDDPSVTFNELLDSKADYVIVTYQFLASRYRSMLNHAEFYEQLGQNSGADKTMSTFASRRIDTEHRITCALFSRLYRDLDLPIKHLILDEAQFAKNRNGLTHRALKALHYRRIYMLSGTFLSNRWSDIYGLLDFLHGHPFTDYHKFEQAFAGKVSDTFREPSVSKNNRLVKFLQAIVVSRPSSLLKLPGLHVKYVPFLIDDTDIVQEIAYWTILFFRALRRGDVKTKTGLTDVTSNDRKRAALQFATRAQQSCAHPLLQRPSPQSSQQKLVEIASQYLEQFMKSFEARRAIEVDGNSQDDRDTVAGESQATRQTRSLAMFMEQGAFRTHDELEQEQTTEEKEADDEAMDTDEDEEDRAWLPEHNKSLEQENDGDAELATDTMTASKDRPIWLKAVADMTMDQLLSAKTKAIIAQIKFIVMTWPGEKIAIFSKFLKYLDIIAKALQKDEWIERKGIETFRFDGTTSSSERQTVRTQFADAVGSAIILITAGSGGAGMNLTAASHVIQTEPWWNGNDEQQAYYRAYRSGQKKEVHAWVVRGENSVIDFVLELARDKKTAVNDKIMKFLRRADDDKVVIPRQFKGGVGEN